MTIEKLLKSTEIHLDPKGDCEGCVYEGEPYFYCFERLMAELLFELKKRIRESEGEE